MEIKIEKYLSEEQMKTIAEEVFTEKMKADVDRVIQARTCGKLVDNIFNKIVESYVTEISDKYKDDILKLCKSEISRDQSNNNDWDDTLRATIDYKLKETSNVIIDEHIDEIKPIVYSKILRCCNEVSVNAFISDIIRKLDLDKAVKEVLGEYAKKI
jgi:uncharacterized membrane protein YheB (UPF0754 family)